jgi:VanZ family protein
MDRARMLNRIILAIYWLAIFTATHVPQSKIPPKPVNDKLAHFGVFLVLGALLWPALGPIQSSLARRAVFCLAILCFYGAIDELTQPLFNRFCTLDDWLADGAGGATAVVLMTIIHSFRFRRVSRGSNSSRAN